MAEGTINNPASWEFVQDCISGTKVTGSINLYADESLRMCYLSFDITASESLSANAWLAIGSTPSAYRPKADVSMTTENGHRLYKNGTNNVIGFLPSTTISTGTAIKGSLLWVY